MRLVLLALVLGVSAAAAAPADDLAAGNEAFWKGDFAAAASAYRRAAEGAPDSADVWFNLGTAEARAGRLGHAIHALEQALALRPGDADVAHNLEQVRAVVVSGGLTRAGAGRVILPGDDDTGTGLLTALTPGTVAWTFAGAWLVLFALLAAWRRAGGAGARTAAGFGAVLAALVAAAAGALLLGRLHVTRDLRQAVVVADQAPVHAGPGAQYNPSATVLSGVKVRVRGEDQAWRHVTLPDGSEGWLPATALAELAN